MPGWPLSLGWTRQSQAREMNSSSTRRRSSPRRGKQQLVSEGRGGSCAAWALLAERVLVRNSSANSSLSCCFMMLSSFSALCTPGLPVSFSDVGKFSFVVMFPWGEECLMALSLASKCGSSVSPQKVPSCSSAGQAAQKAPVAPAASGAPSVFVATAVHAYR